MTEERSQRGDHFPVAAPVIVQADDQSGELGDREAPPDSIDAPGQPGEQPGSRKQNQQLTADTHDHAVNSFADGLEDGGKDDSNGGEDEAGRDDPQHRG